jgi:hypothetical protein
MTEQHLLVDYENVQPGMEDLLKIAPKLTDVWLFHGPNQTKRAEQVKAAHERVTLVPHTGKGKNALDFHLSFYLGYVAARHPDATLVVVANDKGYDSMLSHAKLLGFTARRVGFKAKKPAAVKAVAPAKKTPGKKAAVKKDGGNGGDHGASPAGGGGRAASAEDPSPEGAGQEGRREKGTGQEDPCEAASRAEGPCQESGRQDDPRQESARQGRARQEGRCAQGQTPGATQSANGFRFERVQPTQDRADQDGRQTAPQAGVFSAACAGHPRQGQPGRGGRGGCPGAGAGEGGPHRG